MRRQGQTVGGRCGAVGGVVDGGIGRRKQRQALLDGIRAWGREGSGDMSVAPRGGRLLCEEAAGVSMGGSINVHSILCIRLWLFNALHQSNCFATKFHEN